MQSNTERAWEDFRATDEKRAADSLGTNRAEVANAWVPKVFRSCAEHSTSSAHRKAIASFESESLAIRRYTRRFQNSKAPTTLVPAYDELSMRNLSHSVLGATLDVQRAFRGKLEGDGMGASLTSR